MDDLTLRVTDIGDADIGNEAEDPEDLEDLLEEDDEVEVWAEDIDEEFGDEEDDEFADDQEEEN